MHIIYSELISVEQLPEPNRMMTVLWMSLQSRREYICARSSRLATNQNGCYNSRAHADVANSLCKQIMIYRFLEHSSRDSAYAHGGPVWNMFRFAKDLSLGAYIQNSINTGTYVSLSEWKTIIKSRLVHLDHIKWRSTCMLFKSLTWYRGIFNQRKLWSWWKYTADNPRDTYSCKTLINIASTGRILKYDKSCRPILCPLCNERSVSEVPHILFNCCKLENIRSIYWSRVINAAPTGLVLSMMEMRASERVSLICRVSEFHIVGSGNRPTEHVVSLYI